MKQQPLPEELQHFLACQQDGSSLLGEDLELLDKFGLAGTDLVNQLHRN